MGELDRIWLDALLVAEGLFFGNNYLLGLGLGDYLLFTSGLPDLQPQLLNAFIQDGASDLIFFALTNPSPTGA
jgi:hypothetical protein